MLALYLAACHSPEAASTVSKCSWRWTQKASETCRAILQLQIHILPRCIMLVLLYILTYDARKPKHKIFIPLWRTRGVSRTRTLTLCVSHWSGCSFSENTKLCVAKLITNSNPTVRCISINQVDDGTEQVRKCMHCMIITVPWLSCTGWFVVYLCLSNDATIDVQLLAHWC